MVTSLENREEAIVLPHDSTVLCFSDTHFPYHHPSTFEFLEKVKEDYQPNFIVHNGDLTDSYAFSRYPKDSDYDECFSAEFASVRYSVKVLGEIFPELSLVSSNHDDRLWDRAKIAGIPKSVLLPFKEIVGATKLNWSFVDDLILQIGEDFWYFAHYRGSNVLRIAESIGMSYVQGHTHTRLSTSSTVGINRRLYGCECGCLLGDDRHAFAYNKTSTIRPNLGCILIQKGVPKIIPLQ